MKYALAAAIAVGIAMALTGSPLVAASDRPKHVPGDHPPTPRVMIACFGRKTEQFVAEVRPRSCRIAGVSEIGSHVDFPIRGVKWEGWGARRAFGTAGVNSRTGHRMRVMAFVRMRCADGRFWYAKANIVDIHPGANVVARLRPRGDLFPSRVWC